MSCYHPYAAVLEDDGKLRFVSGWKTYEELKIKEPNAMLLPCNRCIGCKLDYSRKWADRMMLEMESAGSAIFLTLTYNCRNVVNLVGEKIFECEYPEIENTKDCPLNKHCGELCKLHGSLYKKHVQLFMKRFRKEMDKYGIKLRFYACGEYGSFEKNTHRPHYHIIVFGVGTDFFKDKKSVGYNELRQPVFTSPIISNCWDYGNISFGECSWKSCAYVARYVTKKAIDVTSDDMLDAYGKNHMFSLMSRKPGIGRPYLNEHPDCLDFDSIFISTPEGARKIAIPRYFVNQLNRKLNDLSTDKDLYEPEKYDRMIAQRAMFAEDAILGKLFNTDLELYEYLENEERKKLESIKSLKRHTMNLY